MSQENTSRAAAEGAVRTCLIPAAYMCEKKSIRAAMLDDDLRRFYGCMLLYDILPRLKLEDKEKSDLAMTLSQALEMSREASVTALSACAEALRDWVMPLLSEDTPCLALGMCMALSLLSGPHDEFEESDNSRALFRGLSPDMPADTLLYAVFSDAAFWGKRLTEEDEVFSLLYQKMLDLQVLGLRGAMIKCCDERKESHE